MHVLLAVIYSWSIFRGPLAQLHGWTKAQTIAPYRYSILTFAAGMILAGFWQDRKGPRVVASAGGFLLGTGCLLAAWIGDTVGGLVVAYGVVAARGPGCGGRDSAAGNGRDVAILCAVGSVLSRDISGAHGNRRSHSAAAGNGTDQRRHVRRRRAGDHECLQWPRPARLGQRVRSH